MRKQWMIFILFFWVLCSCSRQLVPVDATAQEYIEQWKIFYPTRAYSFGDLKSAFVFEEFSAKKIDTSKSFG